MRPHYLRMFTVSLHGIKLHAKVGLYPEEKITGNDFEIDVDVTVDIRDTKAFPFIDYAIIGALVTEAFRQPGELIETFAKSIHQSIVNTFSEADKVKVTIRKMHPPLSANVAYSQVSYEG